MPKLEINGASIHYEEVGAGPPLLLVAGIASDGASWRPLVPLLSPEFRLITVDNRGCGRTVAPGPLAIADMVADCAALIGHLGLGPVDVVGHSMGGYLGLLLASENPGLVRRLVTLASGPLSPRSRVLFRHLSKLYATLPAEDWFKLLYPWLFSDAFFANETMVSGAAAASAMYPFRQSPADFSRQVAAIDRGPALEVERVRCPVLAVSAELDLLAPPAAVRAMHAGIPGVAHREIPGAAHSVHWEAAEAVAEVVRGFLA
jgi:aminoacrylate hydrolase